MKRIDCRVCGKTLGYVPEDCYLESYDCLCEEHYKKFLEEEIDFTIVTKPSHISLDCPFCGQGIEIKWDDVPNNYENWEAIRGEEVECPECHEYIKLGSYDLD